MEWIEISKQMPDNCEYVLVSTVESVLEAYLSSDKKWLYNHPNIGMLPLTEPVIAWMPFPKPYKP